MNSSVNTFLKANCLGAYGLALLNLLWPLPWGAGPWIQGIALALLAIHLLETLWAYRYLHLYRGPLALSVLLSLLFGLMHWLPLARKSQS
jgi:uncharacterized protein YhhL (DUF1145 family)